VRELASQIGDASESKSPTVIINCMTPGACKSDFDRESTGVGRVIHNLLSAIIGRTTEAGSRTLVAGVAAGEESHGAYMADSQVRE
jgi:retinol dehydrogenase-12